MTSSQNGTMGGPVCWDDCQLLAPVTCVRTQPQAAASALSQVATPSLVIQFSVSRVRAAYREVPVPVVSSVLTPQSLGPPFCSEGLPVSFPVSLSSTAS